jgi:hypothetical protein
MYNVDTAIEKRSQATYSRNAAFFIRQSYTLHFEKRSQAEQYQGMLPSELAVLHLGNNKVFTQS